MASFINLNLPFKLAIIFKTVILKFIKKKNIQLFKLGILYFILFK